MLKLQETLLTSEQWCFLWRCLPSLSSLKNSSWGFYLGTDVCWTCYNFRMSWSLIIWETLLHGSCHQLWRGTGMMRLTSTAVILIAVTMCCGPGPSNSILLNPRFTDIILLNPYATPWHVLLCFHFIDGRTKAQKVLQDYSGSKRQRFQT